MQILLFALVAYALIPTITKINNKVRKLTGTIFGYWRQLIKIKLSDIEIYILKVLYYYSVFISLKIIVIYQSLTIIQNNQFCLRLGTAECW